MGSSLKINLEKYKKDIFFKNWRERFIRCFDASNIEEDSIRRISPLCDFYGYTKFNDELIKEFSAFYNGYFYHCNFFYYYEEGKFKNGFRISRFKEGSCVFRNDVLIYKKSDALYMRDSGKFYIFHDCDFTKSSLLAKKGEYYYFIPNEKLLKLLDYLFRNYRIFKL